MTDVDQISEISAFRDLPPELRARLAETAEEITCTDSGFIVHQHDEARWVFVLLSGSVQFLLRMEGVDDLLVGATGEPGELIGWSVFRRPYRYTASVRCEGTCRLLRIPRERLVEIMDEDPALGHRLLVEVTAAVARRLEQTKAMLVASESDIRGPSTRSGLEDDIPEALTSIGDPFTHSSFFDRFPEEQIKEIASIATDESFDSGESLFKEGDKADRMFVLVHGPVRLSYRQEGDAPAETHIRTLSEAGETFGWSAMLQPHTYRATATAVGPVSVKVIGRSSLESLCVRDPRFGINLMTQILWVIGNRLRSTRIRLIARRYEEETLAIEALLDQSAESLHVTSPLHKIPYYLGNRLTLSDAFDTLELLKVHGDATERHIAGLALEILAEVRLEMRVYQHQQRIYEHVANSPESTCPDEIRRLCCEEFVEMFSGLKYVIRGEENLPSEPGQIFIMNHLCNHPDNTLPNDFQLTLDTHFVSAMIIYRKYGQAPIRVIRKSRPDESGHQKYYDRLGYLYVFSGHVDEGSSHAGATPEKRRTEFLEAAREHLLKGRNIVICPEGTSKPTEQSPVRFKSGAFRLAAFVRPEPLIVPIAVAHFDRQITRTRTACVVHPPFRLSEFVSDPIQDTELFEFINAYNDTFKTYVREAVALAERGA